MIKTLSQVQCEDKCQLVKRPQLQMNKTSEADMFGGPLPYAFKLSNWRKSLNFTDLLGAVPTDHPFLRVLQWLTLAKKAIGQLGDTETGKRYSSLSQPLIERVRCEDKYQLVKRLQLQMNNTSEAGMSGGPLPYAFELSNWRKSLNFTDLLGAVPTDHPFLRVLQWLTLAKKAIGQLGDTETRKTYSSLSQSLIEIMMKTLSQVRCEDKCQLVKTPQLQMNKTSEADMFGGPLPYAFELR
ncbi:hypothetical protein SADUNF_Sadunf16G0292100 [Salix dunnii]|uniref:Uncharacterized protein n=1 Tax=Salix dunnii TaxID=1413687 RepID=A0A835JH29_9ROSI|nr:hypothetical protein SADUNF_Sadunf16G0292100 [Salix dunnii]